MHVLVRASYTLQQAVVELLATCVRSVAVDMSSLETCLGILDKHCMRHFHTPLDAMSAIQEVVSNVLATIGRVI